MAEPATHEGSCLCGAIQFSVKGDPFLYVLCHCINCKKASGSAFLANAWFKYGDVTIKKDDLLGTYRDKATKSEATLVRHFCTKCGSTMFIYRETKALKKGDVYVVPAPLIDGFQAWTPHRELFAEDRCPFLKEVVVKPKVKGKL